jgi:hypothetical protein
MRRVWLSLALAAAVVTLVATVAAAVASSQTGPRYPGGSMMGAPGAGSGSGMMGGGMMTGAHGMMGGIWLAGDGIRITSIAAARTRAATAATGLGLRPGEVIWFDNGFYVELKDAAGESATEVLVDPVSGVVSTEPGPAMMWNTRYGMHPLAADGTATVSAEQARRLADAWLAANRPGRRAEAADAYPGYYTLEFTRGGTVDGMLSINATTGQVWYHSWHGRFITREDA